MSLRQFVSRSSPAWSGGLVGGMNINGGGDKVMSKVMLRWNSTTSKSSLWRAIPMRQQPQFARPLVMGSGSFFLPTRLVAPPLVSPVWQRTFSSQANNDKNETKKSSDDNEDDPTKEIVLTPGEKVVAATRLSMWLGILAFASVCAYYIGKELIPTKMSPNTVFNGASKVIKENPQVQRQYGEKLKFYGKDHGGHREGRRNFIEHTEYTNEEDGSKRTRVRFNLEGQFATAFCFAEVSNQYDDYVYILVQDKQTGRVLTVKDNRAAMTAQRLSGGNTDTANAMKQLLGGGGSSNGGK